MGINFPNSPSVGDTWPNPPVAGIPVYHWNGYAWVTSSGGGAPAAAYVQDTPPANATAGALWWNSATAQMYIYYKDVDTSQWVMIVSAPTQPVAKFQRNYFINGAMMISQENGANASSAPGYYPVDQFIDNISGVTASVAQVSSPTPSGSPNRIRFTNTSAHTTVAAGDTLYIYQAIEGLRMSDLRFGTSSAKTVTVQLGIRAPAGTYCVAFRNVALNRHYTTNIVIAAGEANTDVVKSVTVAGDTTGTWAVDNTSGLYLTITLAAGTTWQAPANVWAAGDATATPSISNFCAINGAIFELFDVGLYEGITAPPFAVPDYVSELALCQRYYETIIQPTGTSYPLMSALLTGANSITIWPFRTRKRAAPTFSLGPGVAWVNATPTTIAPGLDQVYFQNSSTYFYPQGATAGAIGMIANARM